MSRTGNAFIRASLGISGVVLADRAFEIWSIFRPWFEGWEWRFLPPLSLTLSLGAAVTALAAGSLILILSSLTGRFIERASSLLLGLLALLLLLEAGSSEILHQHDTTDSIAYTRYAAGLLIDGKNPYTASMTPSLNDYGVHPTHRTYLTGGGTQDSYPYPSLHILLFTPGEILGLTPRITILAVWFAFLSYVALIPPPGREVMVAGLLIPFSFIPLTFGGTTDLPWAVLLALAARPGRSPGERGILAGLALAYKQPAILGILLLLVRIYREEGREPARGFAVTAAAAAFIPQVPFLVAAPHDYISSVTDILRGGLVPIGHGASLLAVLSGNQWLIGIFKAAGIVILASGLYLVFSSSVWRGPAIWLIPPISLFFWPRFLQTYLIFWYPPLLLDLAFRRIIPLAEGREWPDHSNHERH